MGTLVDREVVGVAMTTVFFVMEVTTDTFWVTLLTTIVQLFVFSEADTSETHATLDVATSLTMVATAVEKNDATEVVAETPVTKTAVAVSKGTSIRNQAVPSLAMAQSTAEAVPWSMAIGKKRFVATTVLSPSEASDTSFCSPTGQLPVKVPMRKVCGQ